jgi:predicted  nucleic acid-binding Zn-ribbon protein
MDRDLPQKHETLRVEYGELLQQFKELQTKASKQEEFLSGAQRQTEEIQREGEAVAQENSNLHQAVRTLNSQIETTTELIKINSAQIGVLGRNRHYLLEKIGSLISECKTDADAQRTVAEVMDKELEAKQEYAMLQNQITRLTGVGDPNAALSMMFKV